MNTSRTPRRTGGPHAVLRMLAGVLAAAAGLAVAELVSVLTGPTGSPVTAVGAAVVDRTPIPLKEFAIRNFGDKDKLVLLASVSLGVLAFAAVLGLLAWRYPLISSAGIGAVGLAGTGAALTRPVATWIDALPSVAAAVVGVAGLRALVRSSVPRRPSPSPSAASEAASSASASPQRPRRGLRELLAGTNRAEGSYDRRGFLLTAGGVGVATLVAGGVGRTLTARSADISASRRGVRLPRPSSPAATLPADAELGIDGLERFTTGNADFYRVDTALLLPKVLADEWSLRIHGMVNREIRLDFAELLKRPMLERDITLSCVSNEVGGRYAGNARWLGVSLADLLEEAGVRKGADQLVSRSYDGWTCGTPTSVVLDGRDALLAVGMNGEALPQAHGFPVRMVVPGLYGYVSATKWLVDLELTTFQAYDAYWAKRGYAAQAPIKTFSRIDTPRPLSTVKQGELQIAGVAWAQHRGIESVEVRIDDGRWTPAALGGVPGKDTWRQWVMPWQPTSGRHSITVRAVDGTGTAQTEERAGPVPDGASGWHSVVVTVA